MGSDADRADALMRDLHATRAALNDVLRRLRAAEAEIEQLRAALEHRRAA